MLETSTNMVLCGVIRWNDVYEEIYCDDCGALAFETSQDGGCWLLTEVNMDSPCKLTSIRGLRQNLEAGEYGDAIGVAYSEDGKVLVFLDECRVAERTMIDTLTNVSDVFYYSTDEEYIPAE